MRFWCLTMVLGLSCGCTNWALQRTTLSHAESSMDLRYQQVIQNLAMIAWSPEALPAYSSIYSGTADVNDNLKLTSQTTWVRALHPAGYMTAFGTASTDSLGSRAIKGTWTLDPVVVPEKLRAIRAACRWVLFGPENVGPDLQLLKNYEPPNFETHFAGDPPGPYFFVIDRLLGLPPGWLHCSDSRFDVPRNACYCAGCHGRYVWVGPEGMEGLSEFLLVVQAIARTDFTTLYYPRPQTTQLSRTIRIDPNDPNVPPRHPDDDKYLTAHVTVYLDPDGRLANNGEAAIPIKARKDNVGDYSDLKSLISSASKSP